MSLGSSSCSVRALGYSIFLAAFFGSSTAYAVPSTFSPDEAILESKKKLVLAAEEQRYQAFKSENVEVLKSLLGRDYYHVDSNGRLRSKTEFLQAVSRGDFASYNLAVNSSEVEVNGCVAIVRGLIRVEHKTASAEKYTVRDMRLWQLVSGRWVNTMHQFTRLQPSPSDSNNQHVAVIF